LRINLKFELRDLKIVSKVKMTRKSGGFERADLIIDTGCSTTTISPELFKKLGHPLIDAYEIKVFGLNSVEKSYSTILPHFEIGGVNLGPVRVVMEVALTDMTAEQIIRQSLRKLAM
jgi:predicted aspartyl protease